MGSTPSVNVYFAVEAPRSIFYKQIGEFKRVCSMSVTGHTVGVNSKFCDQCGAKTVLQTQEVPTEAFAAFCAERKVNHESAFDRLSEDGWEWSDHAGTKYVVGWYRVQAYDTSELDSYSRLMAIGIRLGGTYADSPTSQLLAYSIEDLTKLVEPLREISQLFQVSTQPKLYTQLRWY